MTRILYLALYAIASAAELIARTVKDWAEEGWRKKPDDGEEE